MTRPPPALPSQEGRLLVFAALADDATTLALLHDRELDAATLATLREIGFPDNLALLPQDDAARSVWQAMRIAVPPVPTFNDIEALAVEYAAIYLTGSHGASPCESVWLDEDHITCQQPMFELRAIYQAAGLTAADWRKRPDDHLVLQLLYIAHQLRRPANADFSPQALGQMMDAHLLRWLPAFAARVAARTTLPFYATLAHLTLAWCETVHALLVAPTSSTKIA
jgi:TorA maturation chaperone TorD